MGLKKHHRSFTLLNILSDGAFHSGESIGQQMGMSRSAVWKLVRRLEDEGITVQSVSGKGYRIANGMTFLDPSKIESHLCPQSQQILDEIICLDQIDSTNEYLLKQLGPHQTKILACFAEQQTAGRGRRGNKSWLSPYGNNIYHSLLWHFEKDASELMGLSIAVAVMVARTLKTLGITRGLQLKWPNDVLFENQKLSGILVELLAQPHHSSAVIIGVGINTRLTIHAQLKRPVTSTEAILNKPTDRNLLGGLLINQLIEGLESFQKNGLAAFIDDWQTLDSYSGKMVKLMSNQWEVTGRMKGISERGELLLEDEGGAVRPYLSGEVSLILDPPRS